MHNICLLFSAQEFSDFDLPFSAPLAATPPQARDQNWYTHTHKIVAEQFVYNCCFIETPGFWPHKGSFLPLKWLLTTDSMRLRLSCRSQSSSKRKPSGMETTAHWIQCYFSTARANGNLSVKSIFCDVIENDKKKIILLELTFACAMRMIALV